MKLLIGCVLILISSTAFAQLFPFTISKVPKPETRTVFDVYTYTDGMPSYVLLHELEEETQRAVDITNSVGADLLLVYRGLRSGSCDDVEEGVIGICFDALDGFTNAAAAVVAGSVKPALKAYTEYNWIMFNVTSAHLPRKFKNRGLICAGLQHEIGHILGLGHVPTTPSVMSNVYLSPDCAVDEGYADGLHFLYPEGEREFPLHCAWMMRKEGNDHVVRVSGIQYKGKQFFTTLILEEDAEGVYFRVDPTHTFKTSVFTLPECSEMMTFDEDLRLYDIPILDGEKDVMFLGDLRFDVQRLEMRVESARPITPLF